MGFHRRSRSAAVVETLGGDQIPTTNPGELPARHNNPIWFIMRNVRRIIRTIADFSIFLVDDRRFPRSNGEMGMGILPWFNEQLNNTKHLRSSFEVGNGSNGRFYQHKEATLLALPHRSVMIHNHSGISSRNGKSIS